MIKPKKTTPTASARASATASSSSSSSSSSSLSSSSPQQHARSSPKYSRSSPPPTNAVNIPKDPGETFPDDQEQVKLGPKDVSAYMKLLQSTKAIVTSNKPIEPGPRATPAEREKYYDDLSLWELERTAEEIQNRTLEEQFSMKDVRAQQEKRLRTEGIIKDGFVSTNYVSVLCTTPGIVHDLVEYLDSFTLALKDAQYFSVALDRRDKTKPYGLTVRNTINIWSDYVPFHQIIADNITYSDPSQNTFAKLPLHQPLFPDPSTIGSTTVPSNTNATANTSTSSTNNAFGVLMRKNGPNSSSVSTASSSSSSSLSNKSTLPPSLPQYQKYILQPNDQIIGINNIDLRYHNRPQRDSLSKFLLICTQNYRSGSKASLEGQRSISSMLSALPNSPISPSSSVSSSQSSTSSSTSFTSIIGGAVVMVHEAQQVFGEQFRSNVSQQQIILRVRRLSPTGQLYGPALDINRPPWILDTPVKLLRAAVVDLLIAEKAAFRYPVHAQQYMMRLIQILEKGVKMYVGEVLQGKGIHLPKLYSNDPDRYTSSSSSSSLSSSSATKTISSTSSTTASKTASSPNQANSNNYDILLPIIHPVVDLVNNEAIKLMEGITKLHSTTGGIPLILLEHYKKPSKSNDPDDDDEIEIIDERDTKKIKIMQTPPVTMTPSATRK